MGAMPKFGAQMVPMMASAPGLQGLGGTEPQGGAFFFFLGWDDGTVSRAHGTRFLLFGGTSGCSPRFEGRDRFFCWGLQGFLKDVGFNFQRIFWGEDFGFLVSKQKLTMPQAPRRDYHPLRLCAFSLGGVLSGSGQITHEEATPNDFGVGEPHQLAWDYGSRCFSSVLRSGVRGTPKRPPCTFI